MKVAAGVLATGKTNEVCELDEGAAFGVDVGANNILPRGDDEGLRLGLEAGTASDEDGWPPWTWDPSRFLGAATEVVN